jgi:hypothetical protein
MKIIICFIIIILLLYFSLKLREKFVITPININNGGIVNIGDQGEWDYANYSVDDYSTDYGDEFKTEILFYKFEKDSTFEIDEKYNSITLGFYLLYPEYSTSITTVSQKDGLDLLTTEVDKLAKFKLINTDYTGINAELMISNGWKKEGSKIRIKTSDWNYVENYDYNGTNYQYTYDTTNLHPNSDPETKIKEYTDESYIIEITDGLELNTNWNTYNSIEKVELSTTELENYCITEIPNNDTVYYIDKRCGDADDTGLKNCEFKDDKCQQIEVKTTTKAGRETNIIDNVLTIQNGDDTYYLKTQIQDNKEYTVTMTNNKNINLSLPNLVLNKLEDLAWFLITINKDEIKLSYQNNPYLSKSYLHEQEIHISNIKFDKITANNYRYLGRIMIWPKSDVDLKDICKHYYCGKYKCRFDLKYLKNKKTNIWNSLGNIDADLCIKECAERPEYRCDIKECQKMCIDCDTPNDDELTKTEKINICPWYTNIKLDIKPPEAPFIRGFPGLIDNTEPNNGSIIIEWKKPFNNMSKITHYILEVKEALTKYNSHKAITIKHDNCDICEYPLRNLKNQTTYEIELSAVNSKGISYKSNKLSITTNGDNNDFLQNIYKDISGDNDAFREYKCVRNFDNSDHILDQVMDEDINIYDYVKSM